LPLQPVETNASAQPFRNRVARAEIAPWNRTVKSHCENAPWNRIGSCRKRSCVNGAPEQGWFSNQKSQFG
jgi:hypothetical protein